VRLLTEKGRWRVAGWVDRLPGTCWSDLVSWALRYDGYRLWARRGPYCKPGSPEFEWRGGCYCGKYKLAEHELTP
jgi:hypothetical protein